LGLRFDWAVAGERELQLIAAVKATARITIGLGYSVGGTLENSDLVSLATEAEAAIRNALDFKSKIVFVLR